MSDEFAQNVELEAAIAERPEDVGAHLVYADWMQAHGNPRGELIALQERRASAVTLAEVETVTAAERSYLIEHAQTLVPDVPPRAVGLRWQMGFIREAHYKVHSRTAEWVGELSRLLDSPSARYLSKLGIEHRALLLTKYADLLEVVQQRAHLPISELSLGSNRSSGNLGEIAEVCAAFPGLETLRLRGNQVDFTDFVAPKLRHLEIHVREITPLLMYNLASAKWDQLESLLLDLRGNHIIHDDVIALLRDTRWPALKYLRLIGASGMSNELAKHLSEARVFGQLETLDLSDGSLTQAGAEVLVETVADHNNLRYINLHDNNLEAPVEGLRHVSAAVYYGMQYGRSRDLFGWAGKEYKTAVLDNLSVRELELEDALRLFDSVSSGDPLRLLPQSLVTGALLNRLMQDGRAETVIRLAREAPPLVQSSALGAFELFGHLVQGRHTACTEAAAEMMVILNEDPNFSARESLVRVFEQWAKGVLGDESVIPKLERSLALGTAPWSRLALAAIMQNKQAGYAVELLTDAYAGAGPSSELELPSPQVIRRLFADAPWLTEAMDEIESS